MGCVKKFRMQFKFRTHPTGNYIFIYLELFFTPYTHTKRISRSPGLYLQYLIKIQ